MSSGPQTAEKLDLSKYVRVLNRRKWWGIIPFTLTAVAFVLLVLAVPDKYLSSCTIEASQSEVVEIYEGGKARKRRQSEEIVRDEITRYSRVMEALAGTEPMREIERRAGDNPKFEGELKEAFWRRISKNLYVNSMGGGERIRVSYLGESPDGAYTILSELTQYFVENALRQEKANVERALNMAKAELSKSREELISLEGTLQKLLEDNPSAAPAGAGGAKQQRLAAVRQQLELLQDRVFAGRAKVQSLRQKIKDMPAKVIDRTAEPPENPDVALYRQQLVELRTQLNRVKQRFTPRHPTYQSLRAEIESTRELLAEAESKAAAEVKPTLVPNERRQYFENMLVQLNMQLDADQDRRERLQKELDALSEQLVAVPQLQRQRRKLERDLEAARDQYDDDLVRYNRVKSEHDTAMEGLISFQIVSPARKPHQPDYRHKVKYAVMGLFVSVVVAVGAVAGIEFSDQSFSDVESARNFLRLPSLGVIPVIETDADRRRRRLKAILIALGVLLLVTAAVVAALGPAQEEAEQLWKVIRRAARRLA
ncbi:MAG: GumC family protein [Planctomycetota bacterium]